MRRFEDILCIVETEATSGPVLARAAALAENNQASLTVASVVRRVAASADIPDGDRLSADMQAAAEKDQAEGLERLAEPYRKRIRVSTKVLVGTPFLQIIRQVLRNGHDLVMKVPEQQDWLDRLFGSNDMHLMRKCPCPVWIIKPGAPAAFRRVLAAVDVEEGPAQHGSSERALSREILEVASSLALADAAELHIAHVWDAPGENAMRGAFLRNSEQKVAAYVDATRRSHLERFNALLEEVAERGARDALEYLEPQKHLLKGWARKEIPALASGIDADLIVMGTVARTGVPGFLMGNTAETILNQIDCSVLAIKPPGFVTPVTAED